VVGEVALGAVLLIRTLARDRKSVV